MKVNKLDHICEFAFVHPKAVNGVLLELIDYKWRELEGEI